MNLPLEPRGIAPRGRRRADLRLSLLLGHRPRNDGQLSDSVFSQWWPSVFEEDGLRFASAEMYMMAGKARLFGDDETLALILEAGDPRQVQGARPPRGADFDDARWKQAASTWSPGGNAAKFGQDDALRDYLLATGDEILVEASPRRPHLGHRSRPQHERASTRAPGRAAT